MYIDEKISLRDNLPDELQCDFKELQNTMMPVIGLCLTLFLKQ